MAQLFASLSLDMHKLIEGQKIFFVIHAAGSIRKVVGPTSNLVDTARVFFDWPRLASGILGGWRLWVARVSIV